MLEDVVKYVKENTHSTDPKNHPLIVLKGVVDNVISKMQWCFWMAHILGWVGIIIPWAIIIVHYMSWWSGCSAETLGMPSTWLDGMDSSSRSSNGGRNKPPDGVMAAVWSEFVLFILFGAVQLVQGLHGKGWVDRKVEVSYIFLSLLAKMMLGSLLFANVIFI